MTISLKVRTPKITEADIILKNPTPTDPEQITWTWRRKGFRCKDIAEAEMLSKDMTVVTVWSHVKEEFERWVVKEPFDEVMLKWEIAEAQNAVFEPLDSEEDLVIGEDEDEDEE